MRSKILVLLAGVLIILFSTIVSAVNCTIETSCNPDNTVMKLSNSTNAHGEIWEQSNYDKYLCCDFTTTDPHSCSGNNKILKLSGDTNAHAEIPTETNYDTDVCFKGLNCEGAITNCSGTKEIFLRLSGDVDAHIAGPLETSYSTLICCDTCMFTFSSWSVSETANGANVQLNVEGVGCDGKEVKFEVFEKELIGRDSASVNPNNSVFNGSSAVGTWVAEWIDDGFGQGNPEYVFKASLVLNPNVSIDNSSELVVLQEGDISIDECANMTSCSNYLTSGECVSDSCDIADGSVEANNPFVDCDLESTSCECAWSTDLCEPSYTEVVGDYIIGTCSYGESTSDDCEDGFLSYSWTKSWLWGHDGWVNWSEGPSESVGDYKLDSSLYYYDPDGKYDGCSDGSTKVECPASVQVGFFGFWNFIIAMVFLFGIYFMMERKKK